MNGLKVNTTGLPEPSYAFAGGLTWPGSVSVTSLATLHGLSNYTVKDSVSVLVYVVRYLDLDLAVMVTTCTCFVGVTGDRSSE